MIEVYGLKNYTIGKNAREQDVFEISELDDFIVTAWDYQGYCDLSIFLKEQFKDVKQKPFLRMRKKKKTVVCAFTDEEDKKFSYYESSAKMNIEKFDNHDMLEIAYENGIYKQIKWIYDAWSQGYDVLICVNE